AYILVSVFLQWCVVVGHQLSVVVVSGVLVVLMLTEAAALNWMLEKERSNVRGEGVMKDGVMNKCITFVIFF
ncbi:hypothetical protein DKP78_24385, partial [Enterococcus faecium]